MEDARGRTDIDKVPGGNARFGKYQVTALLAFIGLALIIYYPALRGGFIWDDADWTIRLDPASQGLAGLYAIWFKPTSLQQYYPLTATSFWIDRHLWGLNTLPYHIENVLLHALTAWLLVRLLRQFAVKGALLAGLLFLVHPVMVESVAWITERKNVLSSALLLGSLLAYGRHAGCWSADSKSPETKRRRPADAFLLFLAALTAKATAVVMPAVVLVLLWWKRGRLRWRQDVRPTLPFFAAAIACGIIIAWMEKYHVGAQGQEFGLPLPQRVIAAGRALWFYQEKLFWPSGISFVYPRWDLSPGTGADWLWPLAAAAVVLAAWIARRRIGRGLVTGLLLYAGAILPLLGFLDVYSMRFSPAWDHWAYVPSLAIFALVSHGVVALSQKTRMTALPWLFAAIVLPVTGILAHAGAARFQDERTLWLTTIGQNPDAWLARYNLAHLLEQSGDLDEARRQYEQCIAIAPEHAEFHNNLANLLMEKGDLRAAETQYREAVKIHPEYARFRINLANVLALQRRSPEALEQYQKAAELEPGSAEFQRRLGSALSEAGRADDALEHFRKSVQMDPGSAEMRYYLGTSLLKHGRLDEAAGQFEEAIRLDPAMANAYYNLGNVRVSQRRPDLAEMPYRKAVELNPRDAEFENNLGWALQKTGRASLAAQHYETALRLNASLAIAHKNLAWILATSPDGSLRDGSSALDHAQRAAELTGRADPLCLLTLGAAHAERGQFTDAENAAREALKIAQDQKNATLTKALEAQIKIYQSGKPMRDGSLAPEAAAK